MPRSKKVAIYHPELDVTVEVFEGAVNAWAQSGWTLVDDEKDEAQLELDLDNDEPGQPDANEE